MSLKAARDFRAQVNASETLRNEVQSGDVSPEGLAQLAQKHGHDVSAADVHQLLEDVELNEWEMDTVAGGATAYATDSTQNT